MSSQLARLRSFTPASPVVQRPHWDPEEVGVTLLKGDLTGIVRARKLSQATMSNIRQNLLFAFIYNVGGWPQCHDRRSAAESPPQRVDELLDGRGTLHSARSRAQQPTATTVRRD